MMENWMMYHMIPKIPIYNQMPPTLYAIMESIVNYGKDDKTKIKDLSKIARNYLFDFDYPLTNNISKEKFETMILNHFIQRRIGFETVTAFKIQLNVKLNEIMPLYNKMFDSIENWNIFEDGEKTIRDLTDENKSDVTNSLENKSKSNANNSSTDISDRRFSDTPENEIQEVQDGNYMTTYNFDNNTNNFESIAEDSSSSNGVSNSKNNQILHEEIKRSPSDKIAIYKEFQENLKNIYSMIFKDLECLFYQLV